MKRWNVQQDLIICWWLTQLHAPSWFTSDAPQGTDNSYVSTVRYMLQRFTIKSFYKLFSIIQFPHCSSQVTGVTKLTAHRFLTHVGLFGGFQLSTHSRRTLLTGTGWSGSSTKLRKTVEGTEVSGTTMWTRWFQEGAAKTVNLQMLLSLGNWKLIII
jgi:hypothetical protein